MKLPNFNYKGWRNWQVKEISVASISGGSLDWRGIRLGSGALSSARLVGIYCRQVRLEAVSSAPLPVRNYLDKCWRWSIHLRRNRSFCVSLHDLYFSCEFPKQLIKKIQKCRVRTPVLSAKINLPGNRLQGVPFFQLQALIGPPPIFLTRAHRIQINRAGDARKLNNHSLRKRQPGVDHPLAVQCQCKSSRVSCQEEAFGAAAQTQILRLKS